MATLAILKKRIAFKLKNLSDDECLKPEHPYSAELAEAVKPENEIEVTRSKPRRFQWMFKLGN